VCRLAAPDHLEVLLVGGTAREPDYWGFPKGRQEPGEPIEQVAIREVQEETGIQIELLALISISEYEVVDGSGGRRHKMVRFFLAYPIGGDLTRRDRERLDARWVSAEEAYRLLTYESDRAALRQSQALIDRNPLYRSLLAGV